MPTVTKQTTKPRAKTGSVLDRIVPVQDVPNTGLKFSLYGVSGTGKTCLACTFPKKLLLIGAENGTRSVKKEKGVEFVQINASAELGDLVSYLKTSGHQTAVLDTASALQGLIVKEYLNLDELPTQYSWGMTDQRGWGAIGVQTKERLRSLLDLADTHGINIVIIAQERKFGEEDNSSEMMAPTVSSALTPSVVGWLNPACDYIGQTFKRAKTEAMETKVGTKTIKTLKRVGGVEYCLRTGDHEVFTTKFRRPDRKPLPEVITDPTYSKIAELIGL